MKLQPLHEQIRHPKVEMLFISQIIFITGWSSCETQDSSCPLCMCSVPVHEQMQIFHWNALPLEQSVRTQQSIPITGKRKQEKKQLQFKPRGNLRIFSAFCFPGNQPGPWTYHTFASPKGTQRQRAKNTTHKQETALHPLLPSSGDGACRGRVATTTIFSHVVCIC